MHELPQRHRITVEDFYRMAEAGLFAEDERVELIEGEIIDVPPMGHSHAGVVGHLVEILMSSVGARAIVHSQLPLRFHRYRSPHDDHYAATITVPLAVRVPLDALACEIDLHPLAARLAESRASEGFEADTSLEP